jgi:hypothetical protein
VPDDHIGTFTIQGELRDFLIGNPFTFKVEVFNDPPFFTEGLTDQTVEYGQELNYQLPTPKDEE